MVRFRTRIKTHVCCKYTIAKFKYKLLLARQKSHVLTHTHIHNMQRRRRDTISNWYLIFKSLVMRYYARLKKYPHTIYLHIYSTFIIIYTNIVYVYMMSMVFLNYAQCSIFWSLYCVLMMVEKKRVQTILPSPSDDTRWCNEIYIQDHKLVYDI